LTIEPFHLGRRFQESRKVGHIQHGPPRSGDVRANAIECKTPTKNATVPTTSQKGALGGRRNRPAMQGETKVIVCLKLIVPPELQSSQPERRQERVNKIEKRAVRI